MQKKLPIYFFILPLLLCTTLLFFTKDKPIGDFGNYYYGSKVWKEGKDASLLYSDAHWFNEQIRSYGEKDYFENYAPVPPISLIVYYPFTFFESHTAKIIFNLLGI